MKRSDFMKYNGKAQLPYKLKIQGTIAQSASIPEQTYLPGDAWIIFPDKNSNEWGSFLVFYDGTQFRLPRMSSVCAGMDRGGKIVYCMESELSAMFGHGGEL